MRCFADLYPCPYPIPFFLTSVVCFPDLLQEPDAGSGNKASGSFAFVDRVGPRD